MGLSADPEKRARQEQNLRKGNPKAFSRKTPGEGDPAAPEKARRQPAVRARPRQERSRSTPKPARPASAPAPAPAAEPKKKGFLDGFFGF
jgi:hypothetical protein